jgi:hypothetical protein
LISTMTGTDIASATAIASAAILGGGRRMIRRTRSAARRYSRKRARHDGPEHRVRLDAVAYEHAERLHWEHTAAYETELRLRTLAANRDR